MIITLTTDFGQSDGYVGAMKGVMLSLAPGVTLVDISHEVHPHDIRQAAFTLYASVPYFPAGSVHLAVVDPGVGGSRRPVAVRTARAFFVAPDNGLLSYVLADDPPLMSVALSNPRFQRQPVSHTFHGRDLFAPAAAHLARGLPLDGLGDRVDGLLTFPVPSPVSRPDGDLLGHVLHVDRFGNLVLDVRAGDWKAAPGETVVEIAGRRIRGLSRTYADASPGELLACVGSTRDHLEIAIREGSAADFLGVSVGETVTIHHNT